MTNKLTDYDFGYSMGSLDTAVIILDGANKSTATTLEELKEELRQALLVAKAYQDSAYDMLKADHSTCTDTKCSHTVKREDMN